MLFSDINKHRETVCLMETVSCPFAIEAQCEFTCLRKDMESHCSDVGLHFAAVVSNLCDTRGKVTSLLIENDALKAKVECLDNKVEALVAESALVKAFLESMQVETGGKKHEYFDLFTNHFLPPHIHANQIRSMTCPLSP